MICKFYTKYFLVPVACIAMSILFSCKKDSLTTSDSVFSLMRVFDDTLGDPSSAATRIIAGNNRIFMAYGRGSIYVAGDNIYHTTLLVTDNKGNLINRDTLPVGLTTGDLLVLDDGSLLIAAYYLADGYNNNIYLFHYNENGEKISVNALVPDFLNSTGFRGYELYNAVHLNRSINGNPLLCGAFFDSTYYVRGYMLECDVNGNQLWSKTIYGVIYDCIATSDGYLYTMPYAASTISLVKTNATGDSLWAKTYAIPTTYSINPKQIIRSANGNYMFSVNPDQGYYSPFVMIQTNENGDSLSSIVIGKEGEFHYSGGLVPRADGGVFAIMNGGWEGTFLPGGTFTRVNTEYADMNADLEIMKEGNFQKYTTDIITAACETSDGRIACFGIIQSYHQNYYKPELIIIN